MSSKAIIEADRILYLVDVTLSYSAEPNCYENKKSSLYNNVSLMNRSENQVISEDDLFFSSCQSEDKKKSHSKKDFNVMQQQNHNSHGSLVLDRKTMANYKIPYMFHDNIRTKQIFENKLQTKHLELMRKQKTNKESSINSIMKKSSCIDRNKYLKNNMFNSFDSPKMFMLKNEANFYKNVIKRCRIILQEPITLKVRQKVQKIYLNALELYVKSRNKLPLPSNHTPESEKKKRFSACDVKIICSAKKIAEKLKVYCTSSILSKIHFMNVKMLLEKITYFKFNLKSKKKVLKQYLLEFSSLPPTIEYSFFPHAVITKCYLDILHSLRLFQKCESLLASELKRRNLKAYAIMKNILITNQSSSSDNNIYSKTMSNILLISRHLSKDLLNNDNTQQKREFFLQNDDKTISSLKTSSASVNISFLLKHLKNDIATKVKPPSKKIQKNFRITECSNQNDLCNDRKLLSPINETLNEKKNNEVDNIKDCIKLHARQKYDVVPKFFGKEKHKQSPEKNDTLLKDEDVDLVIKTGMSIDEYSDNHSGFDNHSRFQQSQCNSNEYDTSCVSSFKTNYSPHKTTYLTQSLKNEETSFSNANSSTYLKKESDNLNNTSFIINHQNCFKKNIKKKPALIRESIASSFNSQLQCKQDSDILSNKKPFNNQNILSEFLVNDKNTEIKNLSYEEESFRQRVLQIDNLREKLESLQKEADFNVYTYDSTETYSKTDRVTLKLPLKSFIVLCNSVPSPNNINLFLQSKEDDQNFNNNIIIDSVINETENNTNSDKTTIYHSNNKNILSKEKEEKEKDVNCKEESSIFLNNNETITNKKGIKTKSFSIEDIEKKQEKTHNLGINSEEISPLISTFVSSFVSSIVLSAASSVFFCKKNCLDNKEDTINLRNENVEIYKEDWFPKSPQNLSGVYIEKKEVEEIKCASSETTNNGLLESSTPKDCEIFLDKKQQQPKREFKTQSSFPDISGEELSIELQSVKNYESCKELCEEKTKTNFNQNENKEESNNNLNKSQNKKEEKSNSILKKSLNNKKEECDDNLKINNFKLREEKVKIFECKEENEKKSTFTQFELINKKQSIEQDKNLFQIENEITETFSNRDKYNAVKQDIFKNKVSNILKKLRIAKKAATKWKKKIKNKVSSEETFSSSFQASKFRYDNNTVIPDSLLRVTHPRVIDNTTLNSEPYKKSVDPLNSETCKEDDNTTLNSESYKKSVDPLNSESCKEDAQNTDFCSIIFDSIESSVKSSTLKEWSKEIESGLGIFSYKTSSSLIAYTDTYASIENTKYTVSNNLVNDDNVSNNIIPKKCLNERLQEHALTSFLENFENTDNKTCAFNDIKKENLHHTMPELIHHKETSLKKANLSKQNSFSNCNNAFVPEKQSNQSSRLRDLETTTKNSLKNLKTTTNEVLSNKNFNFGAKWMSKFDNFMEDSKGSPKIVPFEKSWQTFNQESLNKPWQIFKDDYLEDTCKTFNDESDVLNDELKNSNLNSKKKETSDLTTHSYFSENTNTEYVQDFVKNVIVNSLKQVFDNVPNNSFFNSSEQESTCFINNIFESHVTNKNATITTTTATTTAKSTTTSVDKMVGIELSTTCQYITENENKSQLNVMEENQVFEVEKFLRNEVFDPILKNEAKSNKFDLFVPSSQDNRIETKKSRLLSKDNGSLNASDVSDTIGVALQKNIHFKAADACSFLDSKVTSGEIESCHGDVKKIVLIVKNNLHEKLILPDFIIASKPEKKIFSEIDQETSSSQKKFVLLNSEEDCDDFNRDFNGVKDKSKCKDLLIYQDLLKTIDIEPIKTFSKTNSSIGLLKETFNENLSSNFVNHKTSEFEKNYPAQNSMTKKSIIIANSDYLNSYDNLDYDVEKKITSPAPKSMQSEDLFFTSSCFPNINSYQKNFFEVPLTSNDSPTGSFSTNNFQTNELSMNVLAKDEEAIEFSLLFTEETEVNELNKQINFVKKQFYNDFSSSFKFKSIKDDESLSLDAKLVQSESLKNEFKKSHESQLKIIDNQKPTLSETILNRNGFKALEKTLHDTLEDKKEVNKDSYKESNEKILKTSKKKPEDNNNSLSKVFSQITPSDSLKKFSTCVIIDNGSGSVKCGLSSFDSPLVIPSLVGRSNYTKVLPGDLKSEWIGNDAQLHRGILKLSHPIERGVIKDWIDMEKVWEYAFKVGGIFPEEHPIFICNAPTISKKQQECIMELMLEKYQSPAFYIAPQAVMCLYGCGRISGIVLDVGDQVAYSAPVYEGHVIGHSSQLLELGGRDVSTMLKTLLSAEGKLFTSCAELEICREIKEAHCFVKRKQIKSFERLSGDIKYQLPDGRYISLDSECYKAPELLFRPDLIGLDCPGIHSLISKSILKTDKDLKELLSSNIVLAGGTTKLVGLEQRLLDELTLTEKLQNVKILKPGDTTTCAWEGAKIISSLTTMSQLWITAEEYTEYGKNILHTKCF